MGQDVFPVVRFNHACGHAQRPVEEILTTPWPLQLVSVRGGVPQLATHTFYQNINSLTMKKYTWFFIFDQFHLSTEDLYPQSSSLFGII